MGRNSRPRVLVGFVPLVSFSLSAFRVNDVENPLNGTIFVGEVRNPFGPHLAMNVM